MYLNKVFIIGNLTRDPEIRALPTGSKVCSFSLATNRVWKDKNGAKQESVEYHNVVTFGRQAEIVGQYMKKGSSILVEGRLQTRSWDDKTSGEKKYRTEIVADAIQLGNRPIGGAGKGPSEPEQKSPEPDTVQYPQDEINPDDIPF